MQKVVAAFACVASVIVAIFTAHGALQARDQKTLELSRDLDRLKAQLATTDAREQLRPIILQERVATGEAEAVPSPPPSTSLRVADDPVSELSPEENEHRVRVVRDATTRLVRETLSREAVDAAWADSAKAMLDSAYQGDDYRGVDIVSECRSTMCRLSFVTADPVRGLQVLQAMIQHAPWPANGMTEFDPHSGRGEFYLARDGVEMPQVDPSTLAY